MLFISIFVPCWLACGVIGFILHLRCLKWQIKNWQSIIDRITQEFSDLENFAEMLNQAKMVKDKLSEYYAKVYKSFLSDILGGPGALFTWLLALLVMRRIILPKRK